MAEPSRLEVTERRYGVYLWGFLASSLIGALTFIIVILWMTNQLRYHYLIVFLILLFIIFGVASMIFVELQRRKAAQRREQSAHEWVRRTFQDQRKPYNQSNNAAAESRTTTWASKWNPWKKNNRSSSPPRYETM